jgi:hypothetical protein
MFRLPWRRVALEPPTPRVSFVSRAGLWCERCWLATRVERDVVEGGTLVATLQGCPRCRTGLCAGPQVASWLAEQAAGFFTDGEVRDGR